MDKAYINDMIVSAYEISQDYKMEKFVRTLSKNKKILCVDPDCKNPVLRYCHGDKKGAYFAHLVNTDCDYFTFDKNDNMLFKELRIKLFNHFSSLGYKVKMEHKILKNHYSPIFCMKENETFVIEMGDSKTTKSYIERILNEYSLKSIPVKWIVVGEQLLNLKENEISFLKRYLLNESKNKDFILFDGNKIIQYRMYKIDYQTCCNKEIYSEKDNIQALCVVDGELCIKDYDCRFALWKKQRDSEILQKIANDKALKERQEKHKIVQKPSVQVEVKESITYQNNQPEITETQASDYITSFFTCTECGKKADSKNFFMTQGSTGICYNCYRDPEKYKKFINNILSKNK